MNLYPLNIVPVGQIKRFIIVFYLVGIMGFIFPFTKGIFITITPLALLINAYLLAIYHQKYVLKDVLIFAVIMISGYLVEMAGVHTGIIFGSYKYGEGLGIKVTGTPLLIGLNWLVLTYLGVSIAFIVKLRKVFTLFLVPLLMVLYDFVLEQVAPDMNMWYWQNSEVPFRNYLAWYIIALFFVSLMLLFKVCTQNPLSVVVYFSQFVFFLILSFVL